jgi:diguanylate cyclase (GGDEF)-like protein
MEVEHEPLTGLLKRELIAVHLHRLGSKTAQCSVIILDIDKFQVFNACYGHSEGDQALALAAKVVRQTVPEEYEIFRSDGDEFTILIQGLSITQVMQMAAQLKTVLKEKFSHFPKGQWLSLLTNRSRTKIQSIPFTVSCGIAMYPDHGQDYQQLREAAYEALYKQGKSDVVAIAQFQQKSKSHTI